jgi:hypothetical protein
MADLRLLRPTGTRTFWDSFVQEPERPWWVPGVSLGLPLFVGPVDRAGLAGGSDVMAEYLPGTDDPRPFGSRVVERPELLSAVVGRTATSRDRRRGLQLRELTMNEETYWFPLVRFDISPLDGIDSPRLKEAQLFFREQPAVLDDDDAPNSLEGCAAVKVGGAVRIGGPISDVSLESRLPNLRFRDQGAAGEPIEVGLPSVNVTRVVREWMDRRRPIASPSGARDDILAITPARPELGATGARVEGIPTLPNQRRKQHWVRDRRWRIDGSTFRFRCMSRLVDLHIVASVESSGLMG